MIKKLIAVALIFPLSAYPACDALDAKMSLNTKSYAWTYVKDIVKAGEKSQRFELRSGDCGSESNWNDCATDRERAEVSTRDYNKIYPGKEKWLRFYIYIPEDFKTSEEVKTTLGQIHRWGGPAVVNPNTGVKEHPPLFQFIAIKDQFELCWQHPREKLNGRYGCKIINLDSISNMKGKWTEVKLNFNTNTENGFAKVFINGKQKGKINRPISLADPDYFYVKYGIYNSYVSRNNGPMPTQVVYFDEMELVDKEEELCKKAID